MAGVADLKNEINRTGLIREKVYQYLVEEICHGRIEPGQRMRENQLSKQIGTSRTPVREALHLLERDGLLRSIPRVGYEVRSISWAEVEEIAQIRFVNESLAIRWALKRIDGELIKALSDNLALAGRAIKEGRWQSLPKLDVEFHDILVRASGSDRLVELCQTLRRHMLRYRIGSLSQPEVGLRSHEGHQRIVASLKAKDYPGAKKALRMHLDASKNDIRRTKFQDSAKKNSDS